jgi:hypothetical protein
MQQDPKNPLTNKIPSGIEEATLISAIEMSGYPLQGVVAEKLRSAGFVVTEEWGFIDSDTLEHRAVDISAYKVLKATGTRQEVSPRINLLIECKRSTHPHIFFSERSNLEAEAFPAIAAIRAGTVELQASGDAILESGNIPGQKVLGLHELPFIQDAPRCAAFSKAIPSGPKIQLSGDELFKGIVLPLVKALQYRMEIDSVYFDSERPLPTLTLCICVLDAPMLLVKSPLQSNNPILTPWVRILRLQANRDYSQLSHQFYGIDFIHADALDTFVTERLNPFAEEFAKRAIAIGNIWKTGGYVSNLDNIRWNEIVPRAKLGKRSS